MKRRIGVLVALLITWLCYGLVIVTMADREAGRCHDFGDLAAECSAPFMRLFGAVSIVFLVATLALAYFAMRPPSQDLDGR